MYILIGYAVILLTIGVLDFRKVSDFNGFVLAGRKTGGLLVTFSLMASLIGSGSTMGLSNNIYKIGFPAFWFLAVGGIGLILQSFLLSHKVRESRAATLPDLAEKTMGKPVRILVSLIIAATWVGIIAAQFVAVGKLVTAMTGWNSPWILPGMAFVIILYSFLGGQSSILKTDLIQQGILILAMLFTLIYLFTTQPLPRGTLDFSLLNQSFTGFDLFYYLTLIMGSYFICPMMFSRLLTARTPGTAKRSSLIAGGGVILFAFLVALIGLWTRHHVPELPGGDVLSYLFLNKLPRAAGLFLLLGLLSAVISTVDTSLIMTASVIEHDIFEKNRVLSTRLLILIIGAAGAAAALGKSDIIGMLLEAFAVYTAGIVPAVFMAIITINRRRLNQKLAFIAILSGGAAGLVSNFLGIKGIALAGMGVSLVLSLAAAGVGEKKGNQKDSQDRGKE